MCGQKCAKMLITLTVSVKLAAATGILMAKLNLQDIKTPVYEDILSGEIIQVTVSRTKYLPRRSVKSREVKRAAVHEHHVTAILMTCKPFSDTVINKPMQNVIWSTSHSGNDTSPEQTFHHGLKH